MLQRQVLKVEAEDWNHELASCALYLRLQLHRNTRRPKLLAAPRLSAKHTRQTRPEASSAKPGERPEEENGGCQRATPACRACAVTRQRPPAGRARNAAHPIRRPQGARPRPRPLSSLPSLVSVGAQTEARRPNAPLCAPAGPHAL